MGVLIIFLFVLLTILLLFNIYFQKQIFKLKDNIDLLNQKLNYSKKEIKLLQDQILFYENSELEEDTIIINEKKVKKNNCYKGNRALIGDYQEEMARHTAKVLKNYGIIVDIVKNGVDIVDKVNHGYKYDIIFTNHIYKEGYDGIKTLKNLKKIKDFNTPVVILTVSNNKREYFINTCGFDEYVLKPLDNKKIKPVLDRFLNKK